MPDAAQKPIDSHKRDAARLLKASRSGDAEARARFDRLDNPPADPQLKHALAVVAREAGFAGWTELKQTSEGLDFSEFFASPGLKDSINHWFAGYDEAKAHLNTHGGVLLPYRHQAFVTSCEILSRLGFEADDPDWRAIDYDFIRPASERAAQAIKTKLTRRFVRKGGQAGRF